MNLERRIAAIIRRHPTVGPHQHQADYCAERIVKLVEKFTSTNNARDEICGNDVCEYCAKYGKCFGTQHFPKCFVGRKLSPVA